MVPFGRVSRTPSSSCRQQRRSLDFVLGIRRRLFEVFHHVVVESAVFLRMSVRDVVDLAHVAFRSKSIGMLGRS